jgi:hypothetical protein
MIRITVHPDAGSVTLQFDAPDRERLLTVLADWLARCAGVATPTVAPADLAWTLELRRLLLSPDEPHFTPLPVTLFDEDVEEMSGQARGPRRTE